MPRIKGLILIFVFMLPSVALVMTIWKSVYSLVTSDHPSNKKRGGVFLYYKNILSLRVLDIQYLKI